MIKDNETRYQQCGVAPNFSNAQNLLKKILRKDKILAKSTEKNFLIDPLSANNAICSDSLTLKEECKILMVFGVRTRLL